MNLFVNIQHKTPVTTKETTKAEYAVKTFQAKGKKLKRNEKKIDSGFSIHEL